MIPDFVLQTKEILLQLKAQAEVTYEYWQDTVALRYRDNYLKKYEQYIDTYINGGPNQTGMGLDELLQFIDKKSNELMSISGMPSQDYYSSDMAIHDNHLNRKDWNDDYGRPGELTYNELINIMDKREQNN